MTNAEFVQATNRLEKYFDKEYKTEQLKEMYNILNEDKTIKEYFDIEVRFNIMLADVNKIISESVKELI